MPCSPPAVPGWTLRPSRMAMTRSEQAEANVMSWMTITNVLPRRSAARRNCRIIDTTCFVSRLFSDSSSSTYSVSWHNTIAT